MSQTAQPPRRDIYELEESMRTANNGPSFLPANRPRLTISSWTSGRVCVYNANYSSGGQRFLELRKPWTVVTPSDFRAFYTHTEALDYATQAKDPTPQEREFVTTGWNPAQDRLDAWAEKWRLTR